MKKSLLALAVLGAFAGAASAQSSVTVFGVVDLSINYMDQGGIKQYLLASNQLNSNRLGFRGVEDLGGGLGAGFWLEMGMNNATGNAGGSSGNVGNPPSGENAVGAVGANAGQGQLFNRRSTVSLLGRWGELRLGRDYDPSFWNLVFGDVNGANGLGQGLNLVSSLGSGVGTVARTNNSVAYFCPGGVGGFYCQFQYAFGQSTAGASGNQYQGGRIGWAAGPFDIAAAYSETETAAAAQALSHEKFKVWNVGGSFDFKIVKVYGFYNEYQWASSKQDTYEISAGMPLGAGEFRLSYASADRKGTVPILGPVINPGPTTVSIDGDDAQMWGIGYVYNLSKRTAVYTTYGQINNDGKANFTVLPGAAGNPTGGTSKAYNVGLRHSF